MEQDQIRWYDVIVYGNCSRKGNLNGLTVWYRPFNNTTTLRVGATSYDDAKAIGEGYGKVLEVRGPDGPKVYVD